MARPGPLDLKASQELTALSGLLDLPVPPGLPVLPDLPVLPGLPGPPAPLVLSDLPDLPAPPDLLDLPVPEAPLVQRRPVPYCLRIPRQASRSHPALPCCSIKTG